MTKKKLSGPDNYNIVHVTDEQFDVLRAMSVNMSRQSPRATRLPLYCVYQYEWVFDEDGEYRYLVGEDFVDKFEDTGMTIADGADVAGISVSEFEDLSDNDKLDEICIRKARMSRRQIPVEGQVYFTESGAKNHILSNDYHYDEPFVYVVSAWRNREMEVLLDIVHDIVGSGGAHR